MTADQKSPTMLPLPQRILVRWGTGIWYSEWRPDQPHEDWSGTLEVENGEVAFFVYPEKEKNRVFLINTDWTVPGNVKKCVISNAGGSQDVSVTEGRVSEIIL